MIAFARILCPIDFSDTSTRALTYASACAGWYDAALTVMHVAPPVAGQLAPPVELMRLPSRDQVAGEMERILATVGHAGAAATLVVQEGLVHDRIVEQARLDAADLIVMGTHGRSGFSRLLLGSITEKVLRSAPCPVLTVPNGAPARTAGAVAFTRIICAMDYSPSALRALRYALELGRESGGCVTVLYALEYMDPEVSYGDVDAELEQQRELFVQHARTRLHTAVAGEPTTWCEIEEVVAVNRAYKAVLEQAAASSADLIVMGSQGTGGLELMVYGSNTQHVLRAATCPVLTVHAA